MKATSLGNFDLRKTGLIQQLHGLANAQRLEMLHRCFTDLLKK